MGGSDDIDNAAPLCQNCHARFGANPEKRTEIRQMREFWYDVVKEKYHGDQSAIEKLNETLLKVQAHIKESNQAEIDKLRSEVIEEVKVIRALQEQAAEQLKYVPVVDIPRQANTVVGSSNIQSHGHAGNVEEGSGATKKVRRAGAAPTVILWLARQVLRARPGGWRAVALRENRARQHRPSGREEVKAASPKIIS
jgi:hypothetical protein